MGPSRSPASPHKACLCYDRGSKDLLEVAELPGREAAGVDSTGLGRPLILLRRPAVSFDLT